MTLRIPLLALLVLFATGNTLAATLKPYSAAHQPELVLTDTTGHRHDLHAYRGKVVLVNFWATYCGPCIKEMPSMQRLAERLEDRPFAILAVNLGEGPAAIAAFRSRLATPIGFPLLLDPLGEAMEQWQVQAIPTSYLIDRTGRLRYGVTGDLDWDSPAVVKTIETLLN